MGRKSSGIRSAFASGPPCLRVCRRLDSLAREETLGWGEMVTFRGLLANLLWHRIRSHPPDSFIRNINDILICICLTLRSLSIIQLRWGKGALSYWFPKTPVACIGFYLIRNIICSMNEWLYLDNATIKITLCLRAVVLKMFGSLTMLKDWWIFCSFFQKICTSE